MLTEFTATDGITIIRFGSRKTKRKQSSASSVPSIVTWLKLLLTHPLKRPQLSQLLKDSFSNNFSQNSHSRPANDKRITTCTVLITPVLFFFSILRIMAEAAKPLLQPEALDVDQWRWRADFSINPFVACAALEASNLHCWILCSSL